MSRFYSPIYLSNARKAARKALFEQNAEWMETQARARIERDARNKEERVAHAERDALAQSLRADHARIDGLVREGQALGLDRAGIMERTGLNALAVALAERRIAGVAA